MSLPDLRNRSLLGKLPEHLLKLTLIHILHVLDFLHAEAGVIHTGKQNDLVFSQRWIPVNVSRRWSFFLWLLT